MPFSGEKKKLLNVKMCVLIFSTVLCETFLVLKRIQRDVIISVRAYVFMRRTLYSCQILVKLEFSQQIFEKYSNIEFREKPSSGNGVVPCGQTDMMKLIVAFCDFAKRPQKFYFLPTERLFLWTPE